MGRGRMQTALIGWSQLGRVRESPTYANEASRPASQSQPRRSIIIIIKDSGRFTRVANETYANEPRLPSFTEFLEDDRRTSDMQIRPSEPRRYANEVPTWRVFIGLPLLGQVICK